jgi:hypothetical protein
MIHLERDENLGWGYEECRIQDLREAEGLFKDHQKEAGKFSEDPINIQWEMLSLAEDAGALKSYKIIAFPSMEIVGYNVYSVQRSPFHAQILAATNVAIYIKPGHRRENAREFLEFCENQLRELGVEVVYQPVKVWKDWSARLIKMGYSSMEKIYSKDLRGPIWGDNG